MKEFKPQGFEAMMIEYLIKRYEEAELKQMKEINKGCQTRDNIVIDTTERTFHIEIKVCGYKRGEIPASVVLGDTIEEHVRNPGAGSPFMVSPVLDVSNAPIPFNMPRPPSKAEIEEANRMLRSGGRKEARKARQTEGGFDRSLFDQVRCRTQPVIKELPDIEARQRELLREGGDPLRWLKTEEEKEDGAMGKGPSLHRPGEIGGFYRRHIEGLERAKRGESGEEA